MYIRWSRRACCMDLDVRSRAGVPARCSLGMAAGRPNGRMSTRWSAAAVVVVAAAARETGYDAVGERCSRVENVADAAEPNPVAGDAGGVASHGRALP
jgi:hypothetical protein